MFVKVSNFILTSRTTLCCAGISHESFRWRRTQTSINSNTWVKEQVQYLWDRIRKSPRINGYVCVLLNDSTWTRFILRHFRSWNHSEFLAVFVGVSHRVLDRRRAPSSLLRCTHFFPFGADTRWTSFQGVSGPPEWRIVQIGRIEWFGRRYVSSKKLKYFITHIKFGEDKSNFVSQCKKLLWFVWYDLKISSWK